MISLLLHPIWAQAEIYKWTDQYGKVHFSDKPVQGSEKQDIQGLTGINNPAFNLTQSAMQLKYQDQNGSMIVQGKVNHISMTFILDTGASLVVIPPNIAKQAHIDMNNAKPITLQTANGAAQSFLINLSNITVGQLHQSNVRATIQTVSPNPNIGLLGMSFLSAYKMSIDHDRHLITLEPR